jgi:hypothetical protein
MGLKVVSGDRVPVKLREDHNSYELTFGDRVNAVESSETGWLALEPDGTAVYACCCGLKVSGPRNDVVMLARLHALDLWEVR